jgi:hypothetical protein
MRSAFNLETHFGAYLFQQNHARPNGLIGSIVMTVLQGFADASGTETNTTNKVLTVCGCLSTPERWQAFDDDWQDYLKREHFKPDPETGRYVFHTSSFWTGNNKLMPKNLTKFAKDRIYTNLIGLIRKHTEYRFGYGIWLDDYRRFEQDFPGARIFTKQAGTYASRLCFTWNSVWAVDHGFDSSIEYRFDRGDDFWGEMFEEYRGLRKSMKGRSATDDSLTVAALNDGNKARYSQIQAADIIAWEARNYFLGLSEDHLRDRIPPYRPRREMSRLGEPDKIDIALYRYQEFLSELIEKIQDGLEKNGTLDLYVGEGKVFPTIEDYSRAVLAVAKEDEDHKRKTLRDAYFAKRKARNTKMV